MRYAVDLNWFCQWQRFIGYEDALDVPAAPPGPVTNSKLFVDLESGKVCDHVTLGVDYALLPHVVWKVLVTWYGLSPGSRAVLLDCPLPTYQEQKEIIEPLMHQRFGAGDEDYLVGWEWYRQWKKYVDYHGDSREAAGKESSHPGPVDNKELLKSVNGTSTLKDGLPWCQRLFAIYDCVPQSVWNVLVCWYGLDGQSRPIMRKWTRFEGEGEWLEMYPTTFSLCVHPKLDAVKTFEILSTNTVGDAENSARVLFSIPPSVKCRLWFVRDRTHASELLPTSPDQPLAKLNIWSKIYKVLEVILGPTEIKAAMGKFVLEKRNKDGSWPRKLTKK